MIEACFVASANRKIVSGCYLKFFGEKVQVRCVTDVLSSSLLVATSQLCFVSFGRKESAEHPLLRPTGAGYSSLSDGFPKTVLTMAALKETRRPHVQDQIGFRIGRIVVTHDLLAAQIVAYGSIVIDGPVDRDCPIGSTV